MHIVRAGAFINLLFCANVSILSSMAGMTMTSIMCMHDLDDLVVQVDHAFKGTAGSAQRLPAALDLVC